MEKVNVSFFLKTVNCTKIPILVVNNQLKEVVEVEVVEVEEHTNDSDSDSDSDESLWMDNMEGWCFS